MTSWKSGFAWLNRHFRSKKLNVDDHNDHDAHVSSEQLTAICTRLFQEQRARSDNDWNWLKTKMKDLRRRISIVKDLQEETETDPEKFVKEETLDVLRQKDRQIVQASIDIEKQGRRDLEHRLQNLKEKNKELVTLQEGVKILERSVNQMRTSWSSKQRDLQREIKAITVNAVKEPPEVKSGTSPISSFSATLPSVHDSQGKTDSEVSVTDATLEALLFELQEKFKKYDEKFIKFELDRQTRERSVNDPPTQPGNALLPGVTNHFLAGSSEKLLQELHHQVTELHCKAWRVQELEKSVSALKCNQGVQGPPSMDLDRTSFMWTLPLDVRQHTSTGDSADRVNLKDFDSEFT